MCVNVLTIKKNTELPGLSGVLCVHEREREVLENSKKSIGISIYSHSDIIKTDI